MILERPRLFWNSPPPTIRAWAPIGKDAVKRWREKLRPSGLAKVIFLSRPANKPPVLQETRATLAELRHEFEKAGSGSLARVELEWQLTSMEARSSGLPMRLRP